MLASSDLETYQGKLNFLWLELTTQCNMHCVHCYNESSPTPDRPSLLTSEDYKQVLDDAAALGCRKVQFIGGEPTLRKDRTADQETNPSSRKIIHHRNIAPWESSPNLHVVRRSLGSVPVGSPCGLVGPLHRSAILSLLICMPHTAIVLSVAA